MHTFLLPLCLSCLPPAPQGPNHVTELFSIQHLVGRQPAREAPPWGSLLRRPEHEVWLVHGDVETSIAPDDIAALLRDLAGAAAENGGIHVEALGDSVLAVGEPGEVQKVSARIRAAGAMLARPLQIELAVWDAADRESCPATLGPAEFTRFVGNRTPVWQAMTSGRGGAPVALQRMRWTRYVRDLDVEVAQKQTMITPAVDEFGEGGHGLVRVFPLLGDEFAVHLQFAVSQRRGVVRALQTGMAGAADIELPTLETDYGACSARIPNGGALAVGLRGNAASGGQRILTLRVVRSTPAVTADPELGFAILPCGALTTDDLQLAVPPPGTDADEGEIVGSGAIDSDRLRELLQASLGDGGEGVSLQIGNGLLFARGDAPLLARVEDLLRGLQDRLVRTVSLTHTATLQPAEAGAPAAPASLHELQAPTLIGRQLVIGHLLETNVVTRIDCAIAQEAGVLDPGVEAIASGVWLRARFAPVEAGMHLQLALHAHHAPAPPARSIMPGGVLMATEVARTVASHDGVLANGQSVAHGDGPAITIEGRGYRSALATTARW